jgi:cytochrome c-type biogenesis protein CcmF
MLAASLVISAVVTQQLSVARFSWGGFAGLALAIWVMQWSVFSLVERLRHQSSVLTGLSKIPASIWGMAVAHFGVAIFIIGVTHVNTYSQEKDIRLLPGERYELAGYTFQFDGIEQVRAQNYVANEGRFLITARSGDSFELKPQKRFYTSGNPMTEAAIDTTLTRDVYVSLGEHIGEGAWSVRLYLRSFVACIWLGGLLMALGGLIATTDRRYRRPIKKMSRQQLAEVAA